MKLLVTGSAGLVGSACVDLFSQNGWEVIGIDTHQRSKMFGVTQTIDALSVDIRDREAIDSLFKTHSFDAIIHAAAQPSHDYATEHIREDFDINTVGTLNLLEATRSHCPDAVFVYVSTDKIYGEHMMRILSEEGTRYSSIYPFDESLPIDMTYRSFFGCSKLAADLYVQEYGREFGMKTVCFRPGCITGKNHAGAEQHGFLSYLAKCIKEGKTYKIFGFKGKQVRDQIHTLDLARAFWYFIKTPREGEVYNIGGGADRSVSVLEAGQKIADILGKPFVYEFHEKRQGDRQWDIHDVSKFKSHYPEWGYEYDLQAILEDVCAQ